MQDQIAPRGLEAEKPAGGPPGSLRKGEHAGPGTLLLFTLTTFLSALLLFSVQPMFAKMVLPVLGGSPSVWAVAMLFFQAALLAGYLYAHLLRRRLSVNAAGIVHLGVCALAFLVLPVGLPEWFGEPPEGEPYLWQLGLFSVAVGLPFFAVAANAPLLQSWFSTTGHAQARDPYFLYAASNLGSFLALLGYPLVLEPIFGLRALSWYWTFGFVLLVAALTVSFLTVRRFSSLAEESTDDRRTKTGIGRPTKAIRLTWIGLALVPSALLTAFTNHVSTDVASAPLIWVIPLALYLLTFVLVFRQRPRVLLVAAPMIGVGVAEALKFACLSDTSTYSLLWLAVPVLGLVVALLAFEIAPSRPPIATTIIIGAFVVAKFWLDRHHPGITESAWNAYGDAVGSRWQVPLIVLGVGLLFLIVQRWLPPTPMDWMHGIQTIAVASGLFALSQTRYESWFISATIGVIVFLSSTIVAHRTLYEARPEPRYLTEFYLWMSFGGALGGLFAALIAPKIFTEVYEYPLLVGLTMACRPRAVAALRDGFRSLGRLALAVAAKSTSRLSSDEQGRIDELMVLFIVATAGMIAILIPDRILELFRRIDVDRLPDAIWWIKYPAEMLKAVVPWSAEWGTAALIAAIFGAFVVVAWRHPSRQLAAALVMCVAVVSLPSGVRRADAERSYFGVYRVYSAGAYNILMHGTTLHGAQRMRDDMGHPIVDISPTTYYHPGSPMARSVEIVRERVAAEGRIGRYGVIGLGTGSLSCHAKPGEHWRIFEIDPVMISISRNPDNFSYLEHCQPNPPDIVVGDARLTLAREPSGSLDLIVVDAFSSDAVPIHLMTAEALKIYLDKIGPDGVAVLHVSNRYLDLDGVLAATAKLVPEAHGVVVSDDSSDNGYSATASTIVVFTKSQQSLDAFRNLADVSELDDRSTIVEAACQEFGLDVLVNIRAVSCRAGALLRAAGIVPDSRGLRPWTDDFSDVLGPFLTKMRSQEQPDLTSTVTDPAKPQ